MSGFLGLLRRVSKIGNPPETPKGADALKFGMLGAARIGPNALILPARSHAEVIISAVACRDEHKGAKYAKTHKISKVYSGTGCYQQLIDDPSIDVVYNALPNSLHYEWTARAIAQGKHVLCEKPMADTAEEVAKLLEMAEQKGVVLLEAIHWSFHPAAQRVKEIVDSGELGNIKSIHAEFAVPSLPHGIFFLKDDFRFQYKLGGGVMMDMGVYPLSAIRYFTSSDPLSVVDASAVGHRSDTARVDRAMHARFSMPNSVDGEIFSDSAMIGWGPFHVLPHSIKGSVFITLEGGNIELYNFPLPHAYHSITVKPRDGKTRVEKQYQFKDGLGEDWWSSYRYQLEAFVDQVKGRTPQTWPSTDEAVKQAKWVEEIYAKAGMPSRPVSEFFAH